MQKGRPEEPPFPSRKRARSLLELDGSAGFLDLLLDLLGLVLGNTLLDGLRSAFDQRLRLAEAKAGDRADFLDHVDLLAAVAGENHVKFGLLFGGRSGSTAAGGSRASNRDRGRSGTPHFSSSALARSAASRTVNSESWSTSLVMSAISYSLVGHRPDCHALMKRTCLRRLPWPHRQRRPAPAVRPAR